MPPFFSALSSPGLCLGNRLCSTALTPCWVSPSLTPTPFTSGPGNFAVVQLQLLCGLKPNTSPVRSPQLCLLQSLHFPCILLRNKNTREAQNCEKKIPRGFYHPNTLNQSGQCVYINIYLFSPRACSMVPPLAGGADAQGCTRLQGWGLGEPLHSGEGAAAGIRQHIHCNFIFPPHPSNHSLLKSTN